MARLVKSKVSSKSYLMRNNKNGGDLRICGSGRDTFLWSGKDGHFTSIQTFSGPKTLEKFARSLLKALGKGDV